MFKKCNKFVIVGKPQPSGKKKVRKKKNYRGLSRDFWENRFQQDFGVGAGRSPKGHICEL